MRTPTSPITPCTGPVPGKVDDLSFSDELEMYQDDNGELEQAGRFGLQLLDELKSKNQLIDDLSARLRYMYETTDVHSDEVGWGISLVSSVSAAETPVPQVVLNEYLERADREVARLEEAVEEHKGEIARVKFEASKAEILWSDERERFKAERIRFKKEIMELTLAMKRSKPNCFHASTNTDEDEEKVRMRRVLTELRLLVRSKAKKGRVDVITQTDEQPHTTELSCSVGTQVCIARNVKSVQAVELKEICAAATQAPDERVCMATATQATEVRVLVSASTQVVDDRMTQSTLTQTSPHTSVEVQVGCLPQTSVGLHCDDGSRETVNHLNMRIGDLEAMLKKSTKLGEIELASSAESRGKIVALQARLSVSEQLGRDQKDHLKRLQHQVEARKNKSLEFSRSGKIAIPGVTRTPSDIEGHTHAVIQSHRGIPDVEGHTHAVIESSNDSPLSRNARAMLQQYYHLGELPQAPLVPFAPVASEAPSELSFASPPARRDGDGDIVMMTVARTQIRKQDLLFEVHQDLSVINEQLPPNCESPGENAFKENVELVTRMGHVRDKMMLASAITNRIRALTLLN